MANGGIGGAPGYMGGIGGPPMPIPGNICGFIALIMLGGPLMLGGTGCEGGASANN